MKLVAVQPADLDAYLPAIDWHLESFSDRSHGAHGKQYYIDGIREADFQCWLVLDGGVKACALTCVQDDELNTVTVTHCAGHDAPTWTYLIDTFKVWAKERGSRRIEAYARPGWERLLNGSGFKKTHVILEMDI